MYKERRVLIVEDDPLVSRMIRGVLEQIGDIVAGEAVDGEQAVELTASLQPDVVLMDIKLPGINGIEATRLIYECCPTPVVILTAHETDHLVDRAGEAGAGAYLLKPPHASEMDRAITIAMARFDDMMELRRLNADLQETLAHVRTLEGLLPICANCKKIRNEQGQWQQLELYIRDHSGLDFTHGFCPTCLRKLYPEFFTEDDYGEWG